MYDGKIDLADTNNPRTLMATRIRPGSRVLEIGCATGFLSVYLRDVLGCQVLGVEIDPQAAAIAESRGVSLLRGDVEDPAVRARLAGAFDYILCGDVLEHLRDPTAVLRALGGLLAADGHVLASIPNVVHWSVRWRFLAGRFDYTHGGLLDVNHLRFFTRSTVARLFTDAGLAPTFDYVVSLPRLLERLPGSARRFAVRRFPGLFTYQFFVDACRRS